MKEINEDINLIYLNISFSNVNCWIGGLKYSQSEQRKLCIQRLARCSFNPHTSTAKVEDLLSHFSFEMPQIIILITMSK